MQDGALTSFELHDLYRTNTAHEQYLTPEIRITHKTFNTNW